MLIICTDFVQFLKSTVSRIITNSTKAFACFDKHFTISDIMIYLRFGSLRVDDKSNINFAGKSKNHLFKEDMPKPLIQNNTFFSEYLTFKRKINMQLKSGLTAIAI